MSDDTKVEAKVETPKNKIDPNTQIGSQPAVIDANKFASHHHPNHRQHTALASELLKDLEGHVERIIKKVPGQLEHEAMSYVLSHLNFVLNSTRQLHTNIGE